VYHILKDYEKAVSCYERAQQISQKTGNKIAEADGLSNRGIVLLQKALVFRKKRGETAEYQIAIGKARNNLKDGLMCFEWAFQHIQDHDQLKISFLETFITAYSNLVTFLIFEGNAQEALEVCERGKARALDDLLILKYDIPNTSQCKPISYNEIQNIASRFSIIFYNIQPTKCLSWLINLEGCEFKTAQLPGNILLSEIVNDAYSVLKVREANGEERSMNTKEKSHRSIPLENNTLNLPPDLLASTPQRCVYDEDITQPLEGLYELLISPVQDKLVDEEEIVIIPDGPVYMVPFAALTNPNTGKYLSETKRIRLAPSLTSLKTLQDSPADFHSKSGALIIGNPKVGEVIFQGRKKLVSDLPGAEREAKLIGDLLGVQPILGLQATKDVIKQHLQEAVAVIHIAAHGTCDGEIFLTPASRGSQQLETTAPVSSLLDEEDYILTMKDVQASGVRPQLVVLSCCHSGRGEVKADGVIGMTRAFLAAGARAVVASLWGIADDATMLFMEKFYKHLMKKESASKSLHLAMKDMREIHKYSQPSSWAPFFLIGDDVTIDIDTE